jgi:UDPglucose 6-dehydrogenase
MKVSVIGQGFVGLSLSVVLASKNFSVFAIEKNPKKLERLKEGKVPFYEPEIDLFLSKAIKRKRISFYKVISDIEEEIDFIFVAVPTPTKKGKIDSQFLKSAIKEAIITINRNSKKTILIIKSTIAPGITEKVIIPMLNKSIKKLGEDFFLAINPEFLREGFAIRDQLKPHVVVIGCQDKTTKGILKNFYKKMYKNDIKIVFTNYSTAELIKYSNNAFLATKISFINSISNLCQKIPGANIDDVAKVIGMDPRIGSLFLKAGPGFGGSCLPKDLDSLISVLKEQKINSSFFDGVKKINDEQTGIIVNMLKNELKELENKTISILGLAFKENSDDIRNSKTISLINILLNKKCKIRIYDPKIKENIDKKISNKVTFCSSIAECLQNSFGVIIMNSNSEFSKISETIIQSMKKPLIIDTRRILKKKYSKSQYVGLGINN